MIKESLTPRQEKFCQEIVAGNNQSDAYRSAYHATKMKPKTVNEAASRLIAERKIAARVEVLRKPVVEAVQKSRIEWLQEIERCAFSDILEIVDQHGNKTGKTQNLKLSDRLDALELFGKSHGLPERKRAKRLTAGGVRRRGPACHAERTAGPDCCPESTQRPE